MVMCSNHNAGATDSDVIKPQHRSRKRSQTADGAGQVVEISSGVKPHGPGSLDWSQTAEGQDWIKQHKNPSWGDQTTQGSID